MKQEIEYAVAKLMKAEDNIKARQEKERLAKQSMLIQSIVHAVEHLVSCEQHEGIYEIKPDGIFFLGHSGATYEHDLNVAPFEPKLEPLLDLVLSVKDEFPYKYFEFFDLFVNEGLDPDICAKLSSTLRDVATGVITDPNIVEKFNVPYTKVVSRHFYLRISYAEKANEDYEIDLREKLSDEFFKNYEVPMPANFKEGSGEN